MFKTRNTIFLFSLLCSSLIYSQCYKLNKPYLDSLKQISLKETNEIKRCGIYFKIIDEYRKTYTFDSIKYYANKAIVISGKNDYNEGMGIAYKILAWVARLSYENKEYYTYITKAIDLLEGTLNKRDLAECYGLLGRLLVRQAPQSSAFGYYEKQLAIANSINDSTLIGISLSDLGQYYYLVRNMEESERLFKTCLSIFEPRKDTNHIVTVLGRYSYTKDFLNLHSERLAIMKRCLSLVLNGENDFLIADVYIDYALAQLVNNQTKEAKQSYELALKHAYKCKSDYLASIACIELANIYLKQNNYKMASKYQVLGFSFKQEFLTKIDNEAINMQKNLLDMEKRSLEMKLVQKDIENKNIIFSIIAVVFGLMLFFGVFILNQKNKNNIVLADKNKLIYDQNIEFERLNEELEQRVEDRTEELNKTNEELILEITKRIEAEETVKKINVELEKRVKERTYELELATKEMESFGYSVSHDLKAPLRGIGGYSSILLEDFNDSLNEEGKLMLTRIVNATKKMSVMIDSLLELSRITRYNLEKKHICLSNIVKATFEELKENNMEREIVLNIKENVYAEGDLNYITIALENLLNNAVKYSRNNPTAIVEFGSVEEDGRNIYYVKDNGCGYDPMFSDKLFEVFKRLHTQEEFPGTGVGLATVKRIINKHGGTIWSESEPGKGASFYFTL